MSLKLYHHPLSSYCWKALIALYEGGVEFERVLVDLGDEASRAAFYKLWPIGKFPLLQDSATGMTLPESSIIIEYLQDNIAGFPALIPHDKQRALEARLKDRFFDLYVHTPMGLHTLDLLRPPEARDPPTIDAAKRMLNTAYEILDGQLAGKTWALGEVFSLPDCAAFPALYYANFYAPVADHPNLSAYLERFKTRASVARVLEEAAPYFHMFPGNRKD